MSKLDLIRQLSSSLEVSLLRDLMAQEFSINAPRFWLSEKKSTSHFESHSERQVKVFVLLMSSILDVLTSHLDQSQVLSKIG
jgi:hypothetical protein